MYLDHSYQNKKIWENKMLKRIQANFSQITTSFQGTWELGWPDKDDVRGLN